MAPTPSRQIGMKKVYFADGLLGVGSNGETGYEAEPSRCEV